MYFKGILAGVLAGALWGLTFVAPLVTEPYTPFDLTLLRYAIFGLFSLLFLASQSWAALQNLKARDIGLLVWLGFSGNVGYYLVMSMAVLHVGGALVALIIGCLPVILAVLGNRGSTSVPFRQLGLPLALIGTGLAVVNGAAVLQAQTAKATGSLALGLVLVFCALTLWTCYGLMNARALRQRPQVTSSQWTALTGVGGLLALVPVALFGFATGLSNIPDLGVTGPHMPRLLSWAVMLGILSSLAATWAWSVASRHLPVSLASQLIVSETLFALIYVALYSKHMPGRSEIIGSLLLLVGVVSATRVFSGPSSRPSGALSTQA